MEIMPQTQKDQREVVYQQREEKELYRRELTNSKYSN